MNYIKRLMVGSFLLLTVVGSVSAEGRIATVISERANLRDSPSQDSAIKRAI